MMLGKRQDVAPLPQTTDDASSAEVRLAVFARDNYRCLHCGEDDMGALQAHHYKFRSQGGGDEQGNLVTVCIKCHRGIHRGWLRVVKASGYFFFGQGR